MTLPKNQIKISNMIFNEYSGVVNFIELQALPVNLINCKMKQAPS